MDYYDTFDENGIFQSSEDEHDVHYKGLLHKVVRVWLYDDEGNLYLRIRKADGKLDSINELHLLSNESIASCFDRAMFEKLGVHFPATSNFAEAGKRKVKIHKVYSDNSEFTDYYFLCDYIGEFDKNTNFFIFSKDTAGLVKVNAKGILHVLNTRTGEVLGVNISLGATNSEKRIVKIEDIYDDPNEDTYSKYNNIISLVESIRQKREKELKEQEKMKIYAEKNRQKVDDDFVSHADENEGSDVY